MERLEKYGNAKMSHIKSEQGGSVVCRLQSHWLYYVLCGLALALAVSEFLIWLNHEGAGRHLLNAVLALALAVYLFLSAKNQQVVFTDSRVVCRGGRLRKGRLYRRKSGYGSRRC